jgi:hypothetical protein
METIPASAKQELDTPAIEVRTAAANLGTGTYLLLLRGLDPAT